jgi:hypothetical protein
MRVNPEARGLPLDFSFGVSEIVDKAGGLPAAG